MGFNVRVECESLVKNCEDNEVRNLLTIDSWVDNPWKVTWEAHAGNWTFSCQTVFRESFRDLPNLRVTRETLCLDDFKECFPHFITHTI